jgi:1-deoxy-D-xylulose-5-phosphate reductoisomerase
MVMLKIKKNIAILGSTGSIGTQTLNIISNCSKMFRAHLLSANTNHTLLLKQANKFQPKHVVINTERGYLFLKSRLKNKDTTVWLGNDSLCQLVADKSVDLVLTAIVGSAGLIPTISAINAHKNIALANKETLVVAGELVMNLAKKKNVSIIPVDSEHSAIFQCLVGEEPKSVSRLILTASGGPFLKYPIKKFGSISVESALKHPNWEMGAKITIDSATLMNKGLELIEACWLFNRGIEDVDVVIHPESIIHSLVEFVDGSIKAQLGLPTMTTPILYAMSFPQRVGYKKPPFSLSKLGSLNFFKPNLKKFPHLGLAMGAMKMGGTAPCALNAANEIAVDAFLKKKIKFLDMVKIVEKSLENFTFVQIPKLDDYLSVDKETRLIASGLIKKI